MNSRFETHASVRLKENVEDAAGLDSGARHRGAARSACPSRGFLYLCRWTQAAQLLRGVERHALRGGAPHESHLFRREA
jgi:hypothetical protein